MKRPSMAPLWAILIVGLSMAAAVVVAEQPPDPSPDVPAFIVVTYTNGKSAPRYNLSTAESAAVSAMIAAGKTAETPPVVVPPVVVVPAEPAADVKVSPGQSWVAAVMSATAGQRVYLRPGDYREAWSDGSKVPAPGVVIFGDGEGKTRIINPVSDKPAVFAWVWEDVTISSLSVLGPLTLGPAGGPGAPGIQMNGCRRLDIVDVTSSGHTFGFTSEMAKTRRGADIHVVRGHYSDNWHPKNEHASGFYVGETDGFVVDGSAVERNGWNVDAKVMGSTENHGGYINGACGPATVRNCLFGDNASHGLQARSGGVIEHNRFSRNAIHLSFGLVNGGGPIRVGGVSGRIGENYFEGTHSVNVPTKVAGKVVGVMTPRGHGIEVGNVAAAGLVIENNGGIGGFAAPPEKTVPDFAFIRVAYCSLDATNPFKGKDVGVKALTIRGNAVTWPTLAASKTVAANRYVYVAPGIATAAAKPSGPKLTVQTSWPPGKLPA